MRENDSEQEVKSRVYIVKDIELNETDANSL